MDARVRCIDILLSVWDQKLEIMYAKDAPVPYRTDIYMSKFSIPSYF